MIRGEQVAAEDQAEETLEELEKEMAELKRRDAEMEQLAQEDSQVVFLQVTSPLNLVRELYPDNFFSCDSILHA